MATAEEVERAIRSLIDNLATADPDPDAVPDRSILCIVPDLDTAFWAELRDARMQGLRESDGTEHADVRLTAKSDDLIALIEGRMSAGAAFLFGRVRIDASPSDLMRLRRLF